MNQAQEQSLHIQIERLSRKFFVGPGDDERFKKWGEQAMQLALEWLKNPEKKKIHADITPFDLAKLFSEPDIPEEGLPIEEVFAECKEKILDNSVRINNPRFIGHMATVIPWFSVVVEILTTAINQNQVKIETALASTYVERQCLSWLHSLVYKADEAVYHRALNDASYALGNMVSGGTIGNLTGLAVAREKYLPGIRQKGFFKVMQEQGYREVVILASKRVHYSVAKSAAILGLGEESVKKIDVDRDNTINLGKLKEAIAEYKSKGALILSIIGIAGTTETGNIDPLPQLAALAKKEDIWFHVDAAWGGALLLSKELSRYLEGIQYADSVVLDGHKMFYLPMNHSCVLFKDPSSLDLWRHNAQYIIRKGSVDIGQTTFEGSRRFNALKLWFTFKMLGRKGYSVLLMRALQLTDLLKEKLDQHPYFERTSEPGICMLTYRFIPQDHLEDLKEALAKGDLERVEQINDCFNNVNVELQKRQRRDGLSFVSRTTLESAGYPGGIVVLRAVLTNILTRSEYLAEILEEQKALGLRVLREEIVKKGDV